MAVNYASKYASKVDERFKSKSLTEQALHQEYEWNGVETVTVFSVDTVPMNDYNPTGTNRYGAPTELGNTKKDYSVTKDRSFAFTIDRKSNLNTQMTMEAGKALARQVDEVIVPEVDTYRIATWTAAAIANGQTSTPTNVTKDNAYSSFLVGQEMLDDAEVPTESRLCYATARYINLVKLDPSFIKASELGQKMLLNGQVGEIDGVPIIKTPKNRMVAKTPFLIIHKSASCGPKKLEDYKTHDNPPGINGWLVEGRKIHDCFVMEQKKKAIFAWREV